MTRPDYLDYLCALCGHGGHYHFDSDKITLTRNCTYPKGTAPAIIGMCNCNVFDPINDIKPLPSPQLTLGDVARARTDDRANLPQTHIGMRYDLILPDWLREMAEVLNEDSLKYGDNSWQRIPLGEHLNHAMAHMQQFREDDKTERHLINMACRIMFAYWADKNPLQQRVKLMDYLKDQEVAKQQTQQIDQVKVLPFSIAGNRLVCNECYRYMWCTFNGEIVCFTQDCSKLAPVSSEDAQLATPNDIRSNY